MARPRKPEDPQKNPIPCARCEKHYCLVKRWPDGVVCEYCYVAAKRISGVCACGHKGILPGIIDARPACRQCSGVDLNLDCVECGAEAEIYSAGRCQRCVLVATAQRLLTDDHGGCRFVILEIGRALAIFVCACIVSHHILRSMIAADSKYAAAQH